MIFEPREYYGTIMEISQNSNSQWNCMLFKPWECYEIAHDILNVYRLFKPLHAFQASGLWWTYSWTLKTVSMFSSQCSKSLQDVKQKMFFFRFQVYVRNIPEVNKPCFSIRKNYAFWRCQLAVDSNKINGFS